MKAYAKFYHLSTGYVEGSIPPRFDKSNRKPIPACGSDSILRLDGRGSMFDMASHAKKECRVRKFIGFKIFKGENEGELNLLIEP